MLAVQANAVDVSRRSHRPDRTAVTSAWPLQPPRFRLAIARMRSDGALDTTFGAGETTVAFQQSAKDIDVANALALQPDGRFDRGDNAAVNPPTPPQPAVLLSPVAGRLWSRLPRVSRPPSAADLSHWYNVMNQGGRAAVAAGIEGSDEAHSLLVNQWFQTYLGHARDAPSLIYFTNLLETVSKDQVLSQIWPRRNTGMCPPTCPAWTAAPLRRIRSWKPPTCSSGPRPEARRATLLAEPGQPGASRCDRANRAEHGVPGGLYQGPDADLLHRNSPPSTAEINYWLALDLDSQSLKNAFLQSDAFVAATAASASANPLG